MGKVPPLDLREAAARVRVRLPDERIESVGWPAAERDDAEHRARGARIPPWFAYSRERKE